MATVLAAGVFDLIHPGHVCYLEEAKKLGDWLVVIVSRDKQVEKDKGRVIIPEGQRLEVVKSLKPVDEAVLGSETDRFSLVEEIRPDFIALGPTQSIDEEWLKQELAKRGVRTMIVRIKKRKECKLCASSKIVERIRNL